MYHFLCFVRCITVLSNASLSINIYIYIHINEIFGSRVLMELFQRLPVGKGMPADLATSVVAPIFKGKEIS